MSNKMIQGRQDDSARRRQRVIAEIDAARESGRDLSVSAIARAGGVDRTFLYRHADLMARLRAAQIAPIPDDGGTTAVTTTSLKADLLNAQSRIARLSSHNKQLERKLSELLGESAWRESGLGLPIDIEHLQRQVTTLEQQVFGLRVELEERDQELHASRAANRELFASLNKRG